jgi:CheY-like chemotaxis protein
MKKRVLIVEDHNIAFMVAKMLFEAADCEVTHAPSGEEALRLISQVTINQTPYHAIYLDLGLPEMTGIEVCAAIRQNESESELTPIPIIAVTANETPKTTAECISVGMIDVIYKPLTAEKVALFLSKCVL